jgi:hypothetical protein
MVVRKLLEIMKEVPYIQKDGEIKTKRGEISVLTEPKVLEMLRPKFLEKGLVMYPTSGRASVLSSVDGFCTTAEINYTITDSEDGDSISVFGIGQGMDTRDKGAGMAMTYSGKYALLKSLMMITGDDPDVVSPDRPFNPKSVYDSALKGLKNLCDKGKITTQVLDVKGKELDELFKRYEAQPSEENKQALITKERAINSL